MLQSDRRLSLLSLAPPEGGTLGTITFDNLGLAPGDASTLLPPHPDVPRQRQRRPRAIVVTDDIVRDPLMADRLAALSYSGVQIRRARDHYESHQRRVLLEELDDAWFLFDRPLRPRRAYAVVKRGLDVVLGALGCLVVLLLAPLLAVLVRLDDGGPLFYRQERVGLHGRPFQIWKFRTMRVDAEAAGPQWSRQGDARITALGRVLRRTRLDELPQFVNVVRGEMTLVGPRPERRQFVDTLSRAIPFYDRRHLMRPGITGWATVRFGYGDSVTDKWHSHEYDLYYLKHRSLRLDLEILVRTVVVMTLRRGQ